MRLALLISLVALALAGAAVAQEKRLNLTAPKAALRGPESAGATPQAEPTPAVIPMPAAVTPPQDPSACRTDCAQTYYFCLSGSDDQCPVAWSRCVLSCGPVPPPAT